MRNIISYVRLFSALVLVAPSSLGATGLEGRTQTANNIAEALEFISENLRPDRIDSFDTSRYKSVSDEILKLQKWTGDKGVLLQVRVATHNTVPGVKTILDNTPLILSPGRDVVDAGANAIARDFIMPGVPDQFTYSDEYSYYIWATPDKTGKNIKYEVQFSEATKYYNRKIKEEIALRQIDRSFNEMRSRQLINNMLDRASKDARTASDRNRARELKKIHTDLEKKIAENEFALRLELARQEKLARSAAFIDKLSAVLSFASVLSSTIASVDAADRPSIEGAKNPEELKAGIQSALEQQAIKVKNATEITTEVRQEFGLKRSQIRLFLEGQKAPTDIVIFEIP